MKLLHGSPASTFLVHLIHKADQRADEMFTSAASSDQLTARQFIVLLAVSECREPSQTDLCNRTGIDRSTLAEIVKRLVSRGLLRRRRTRRDARTYAVHLTEPGRATLERVLPIARDVDKQLLSVLGAHQRQVFEDALRRLALGPETLAA